MIGTVIQFSLPRHVGEVLQATLSQPIAVRGDPDFFATGDQFTADVTGIAEDDLLTLPTPDDTGEAYREWRMTAGDKWLGLVRVRYSADPQSLADLLGEGNLPAPVQTALDAHLANVVNPHPVSSSLTATVGAGAGAISVGVPPPSVAHANSFIVIDAGGGSAEIRKISAISFTTGAVTLDAPLERAHTVGGDILWLGFSLVTLPQWFGAVGDGATNDGDALRTWSAQHDSYGGIMYAPGGVYLFDLVEHPDNANIPVGFWSNCLVGEGAGRTIFRLADAQAVFGTKPPYLIGNREVGSASTFNVYAAHFSIDGNAAGQAGMGWDEMALLKYTRCVGVRTSWVAVFDGWSTSANPDGEGFGFKLTLCVNVKQANCTCINADGMSNVCSGFSASTCTNVQYTDCTGFNSPLGNVFTANKCSGILYSHCIGQKAGDGGERTAFNLERCSWVVYSGCLAGGNVSTFASPDPFVPGDSLGNKVGFVLNAACTDVTIVGSFSAGNEVGVIVKGGCQRIRMSATHIVGNTTKGVSIDTSDTAVSEVFIDPSCVFYDNAVDISVVGGIGAVTWNGYNAPSMPATGVAKDNPFPFPVFVHVTASGATVTKIELKTRPGNNYREILSGPGCFRMDVGASVKVTYSGGTPVWQMTNT